MANDSKGLHWNTPSGVKIASANSKVSVARCQVKINLIATVNIYGCPESLTEILWDNPLLKINRVFTNSVLGTDIIVPEKVVSMYSLINKACPTGGDSYQGQIYGEMTIGSMHKLLNFLVRNCGLSLESRFLDVGSGRGKPSFHASLYPGVKVSGGIEIHKGRLDLSHVAYRSLKKNDFDLEGVFFCHGDMLDVESTDPWTHIYLFDIGFHDFHQHLAKNFNRSFCNEYLISYHCPRKIFEYGYDVDFVAALRLAMAGSNEGHTAYIFKRVVRPLSIYGAAQGCEVVAVGGSEFYCAKFFKSHVIDSFDAEKMTEIMKASEEAFLESGRPKRNLKRKLGN